MSCPYLEKGIVARCCAFGKMGLLIDAMEEETDCFSGNFSDCSFFYKAYSLKASMGSTSKSLRSRKHNMSEERKHQSSLAGVR